MSSIEVWRAPLLITRFGRTHGVPDRGFGSDVGRRSTADRGVPLGRPLSAQPAGIVTLVTVSAEADSFAVVAMALVLLAVVLTLDIDIFRWTNRVSAHLDQSRILVTEKVFGFLLAALALQLMLDGLHSIGVIDLAAH